MDIIIRVYERGDVSMLVMRFKVAVFEKVR